MSSRRTRKREGVDVKKIGFRLVELKFSDRTIELEFISYLNLSGFRINILDQFLRLLNYNWWTFRFGSWKRLWCWVMIGCSSSIEKTALQLNRVVGWWCFYCQPKSKPLRLKTWDFGFRLWLDNSDCQVTNWYIIINVAWMFL